MDPTNRRTMGKVAGAVAGVLLAAGAANELYFKPQAAAEMRADLEYIAKNGQVVETAFPVKQEYIAHPEEAPWNQLDPALRRDYAEFFGNLKTREDVLRKWVAKQNPALEVQVRYAVANGIPLVAVKVPSPHYSPNFERLIDETQQKVTGK